MVLTDFTGFLLLSLALASCLGPLLAAHIFSERRQSYSHSERDCLLAAYTGGEITGLATGKGDRGIWTSTGVICARWSVAVLLYLDKYGI